MAVNGGNNVANAVGTALQFMPQPDSLGVENLKGIQGEQGRVGTGDVGNASFAAGIDNLIQSYTNFYLTREKKWQQEMAEGAEAMLNRASEDDIQRLESIEIAQKYGYATLVDNPYFHAVADKMIGQHNAQLAYDKYQTMYADTPAKTPEEEAKRWDDFVNSESQTYLANKPNTNAVSYADGFEAKKHELFQGMMDERMKREVADKVAVVQSQIAAQVKDIVYNAAGRKVEEVSADIQNIFDTAGLINMEPQFRYEVASKIPGLLAQYGRMDMDEIKQITDSVAVSYRLDGSAITLSSLVSPLDYEDAAVAWRQKHLTDLQMNLKKKYENDDNLDKYDLEIVRLNQSNNPADRRQAEIMAAYRPEIARIQQEHQAKKQQRFQTAAKQSTEVAKQQDGYTLANANIDLALNGTLEATDAMGNILGKVRYRDGKEVDASIIQQAWLQRVGTILRDDSKTYPERLGMLRRLMQYPGIDGAVSTLKNQIYTAYSNIPDEQLQKGIIPAEAYRFWDMYTSDTAGFRTAMPAQVVRMMDDLRTFSSASGYGDSQGGLAIAIQKWKQTLSVPQEERNQYSSNFNTYIEGVRKEYGSAPDIEGVKDMITGQPTVITYDNIRGNNQVVRMFQNYRATGMSDAEAVQAVSNNIRDHMNYFRGALIPDNLFLSAMPEGYGLTDTETNNLGSYTLNTLVTELAKQNGIPEYTITCAWDDYGGALFIDDGPKQLARYTRADIINEMKYLYENVGKESILPQGLGGTVSTGTSEAEDDESAYGGLGDNPFSIFG